MRIPLHLAPVATFIMIAGCLPRAASVEGPSRRSAATVSQKDQRGVTAERLPRRTAAGGATKFELLSVERTGLDFAHNWSPPADYQFEIYNALPGGGVCVGDYDADGWPDVYLTQPYVGSRLYRNLGDFRFEDVTESAGLSTNPRGQGAVFADLDNDGDLDLYVCNDAQPNRLYINQGDGHFVERAAAFGLDYRGASVMMSFADYDRDGDLDGYLLTNRLEPSGPKQRTVSREGDRLVVADDDREYIDVIVPDDGQPRIIKAGQLDHLYRNNGDGTFSDVTVQAGMDGNYWGLSATWWDYDRDGWPDLYVSNDFYGPDQLFHNQRDGTFVDVAGQLLPHTPWYSMGTDVADINNDGWLDLMASDMSATNHYHQKVSMGDMDKNGWFLTYPTPRQYMRNALYLNTGVNRFMEIAYLAGVADTDWTWSPKFGDLDEDGRVDLFVTNGMNRDWVNNDLRDQAERAATAADKLRIWIEAQPRRDVNLAFQNRGDLRFERVSEPWGLDAAVVSYGAALADLDRDGDLDLVVNNSQQPPSVYRNGTIDTHRIVVQLRGSKSNRWGIGARVEATTGTTTQVRYVNLSQGYMSANEPCVHFGLGQYNRVDRLTIDWPSGNRQVLEHLAADQRYVIREQSDESPRQAAGEAAAPSAPQRETFLLCGVFPPVPHRCNTPLNR